MGTLTLYLKYLGTIILHSCSGNALQIKNVKYPHTLRKLLVHYLTLASFKVSFRWLSSVKFQYHQSIE